MRSSTSDMKQLQSVVYVLNFVRRDDVEMSSFSSITDVQEFVQLIAVKRHFLLRPFTK